MKLVNSMKGENIFYLLMSLFLGFFALFAFYIFPNYEKLHLSNETTSQLMAAYPHFKWFILLLAKWSFSLFYIVAELWPNTMFSLLFWQFINSVTNVEESKRFYPLFALLGQSGLYFSGVFLENIPLLHDFFTNKSGITLGKDTFHTQAVLSLSLAFGIIATFTFWILNCKILEKERLQHLQFTTKKTPLNLSDSIKMVISSRYIMLITVLLLCYGSTINLVESPWKSYASDIYKTQMEFSAFQGGYIKYTGILTILFVLFGSNIVRRLGWFAAAVITPVMMFITGILFFVTANFSEFTLALIPAYFVLTDPILVAVGIGAIQNVLSKSSKYTVFDSTKEMAYVPLDNELKTKGKAAADMIGIKIGKSLSAFSQLMIFTFFPAATLKSISPYLMIIFMVICIVWLWGVKELAKEYKKATTE